MKKPTKFENDHGLFVYDGPDGIKQCVGYLYSFPGHGVFSPDEKVEVNQEDVDKHNQTLSQAEIKGLDENCQLGQGGTFYTGKKEEKTIVKTFTGDLVSSEAKINGNGITFHRNGMVFRGRLSKNQDIFNFKRIK